MFTQTQYNEIAGVTRCTIWKLSWCDETVFKWHDACFFFIGWWTVCRNASFINFMTRPSWLPICVVLNAQDLARCTTVLKHVNPFEIKFDLLFKQLDLNLLLETWIYYCSCLLYFSAESYISCMLTVSSYVISHTITNFLWLLTAFIDERTFNTPYGSIVGMFKILCQAFFLQLENPCRWNRYLRSCKSYHSTKSYNSMKLKTDQSH